MTSVPRDERTDRSPRTARAMAASAARRAEHALRRKRAQVQPHVAAHTLPDGRTLTVLLVGFAHKPSVVLTTGTAQNRPVALDRVDADGARRHGWVAVFECPEPAPDGNSAEFWLSLEGSRKPLPLLPAPRPEAAPVHNATWDLDRCWVEPRGDRAIWRAATIIPQLAVQAVDVSPGAVEVRLALGSQPASASARLEARSTPASFTGISRTVSGFRLAGRDLAQFVAGQGLDGEILWDVRVTPDAGSTSRVRLQSRDIADPRAVFTYPAIVVSSETGRVEIRPYWSRDGHLCVKTNRLSADASSSDRT